MTHLRAGAAGLLLAAATAHFGYPPATSAQAAEAEVLARIEQIIVSGKKKDSPTTSEVKVIRGSSVVAATPALSLFADDELITGVNVGMSIIMLDAAAEEANTIHIGPASQFRLRAKRSIFLILGKVLADVRGLFDVVTSRAILGAKGTEFEVRITENETQLLVLEGAVTVKEERSDRGGADAVHEVRSTLPAMTRVPVLYASIAWNSTGSQTPPAQSPQPPVHHQRWLVEVNASAPVRTSQQLNIINRCQQTHLYDVQGPETLPWFNLFARERIEVRGGTSRDVAVELQIDPSNVAASTYEGNAVVRCLDCFNEPGCTQTRELLPVVIKLARSAQLMVGPLEEITLGSAELPVAPRKAQEARVRTTVNWTNDVILAGQPSYSARRLIPNYASPEERAREFRESRFAAIWRRDAGSYERLGEIYTDWGKGAKAVEKYARESAIQPDRAKSADFLTGFAEANRLKGRLEESEQQLNTALAVEPGNASTLNALGNVYMERAEIAIDASDPRSAERLIERAKTLYERSFEGTAQPERRRVAQAVARANVGETHVEMGTIALQGRRLDEARDQYARADGEFKTASAAASGYAFARTGWGDALLGMALAAQEKGDSGRARETLTQADAQYKVGLQEHADLPEAHIGVGDVLLREGRQKEALERYLRGTIVRPEAPAAYFRVGAVLEQQSPVLAARYMHTYLQLQPTARRTGRTAQRASQIVERVRVPPNIRIPNLVGLDDRGARDTVAKANLTIGSVTTRPSPARQGSVIDQNPKAGDFARAGGTIDIVLAVPEGGRPSDPLPAVVPDVVGMTAADAERALKTAGYRLGRVELKNSTRPPGTVTRQDPRPRSSERAGTAVNLEVARREGKTVKVPNLIGDTRDHALKDIREENLVVGEVREQPGCQPGRVLSQDPPKDTRVEEGTTVSITVAVDGPVLMPQIQGLSQQRAETVVRERGLRIGRINRIETDSQSSGTVLKQEPQPNARIATGCPVDLDIAIPIPLVTVPNFVGLTEQQARERLPRGVVGAFSALRLGNVTYRDTTEGYTARIARPTVTAPTVVEQSPAANSQVRRGQQVDLVVLRPPQGVQVPNLIGRTLDEARKLLTSANLALGESRATVSSREYVNRIVSQTPQAGRVVPPGSRVSVVVGYIIKPPEF